uniref:Uncharacterized protein n=1 Tax=Lepeophtheirus salmonis TaxID=72036 RepID=A0A0K2V5T8_LEPSM
MLLQFYDALIGTPLLVFRDVQAGGNHMFNSQKIAKYWAQNFTFWSSKHTFANVLGMLDIADGPHIETDDGKDSFLGYMCVKQILYTTGFFGSCSLI